MSTPSEFDAIVIGAGPAGCSAAAVLAERGRRVALVDKDPRRRYRVGESLIPFCWDPLERLGLNGAMAERGFTVAKHSVQFAAPDGRVSQPFYFFEHTDHPRAKTWQVVRSEFDALLRSHAVARGARVFERTRVRELLGDASGVRGVRAVGADGAALELRAPVTVDASGRDAFAQSRLGWRVPDERLKKMAIWTYFQGAVRDAGIDEGTTTIASIPEGGWFWFIALPGDVVSIGVVADKDYLYRDTKSAPDIFCREVGEQKWIAERLRPARCIDAYRVTAEFSYRSRFCATDGLVLAGDAFSFLDPVFSSGVYLALTSGVAAGDAVESALAANDFGAARFEAYGRAFRSRMEPMRRLVYAFYDEDFSFAEFLGRFPQYRSDLTDCLIGDLERDYTAFFEAVGEFARLPEPLPHGGIHVPR